jgi:hypothetical protein
MPLEGHYARQTTPLYKLSRRELKAATAVLVLTAAALLAVVLFTIGDSKAATPLGCISTTVAGKVGAETISGCGQEAVAACQHAANFSGARAETVVADCKEQQVDF